MKKTQKKFLTKIMGLVMAFSLCWSFGIAQISKIFTSYADPGVVYSTGKEISVKNFPTTVKIDSNEGFPVVDVPNATIVNGDSGENVTVVVTDPQGHVVTLTEKENFAGCFTASKIGDYTVTYSLINVLSGVTTTIKEMKISVTGETASLSFDENDSCIIPETYNSEVNKAIILPEPTVLDADGEEIEGAVCDIVVKKGTDAPLTLETVDGKRQFTIPTSVTSGTYTIRYSYNVGGREIATTTKTIEVIANYETDFELGYSFKTTFPTTAIIGIEKTLPAVQGVNKNTNKNIDTYYTIKIFKRGTVTVDVTSEMLTDENVFTPTEVGDYYAQYTVKDFFGHTATIVNWDISLVSDTQKAVPHIALPYTVPENGIVDEDSITEATWALPSNGSEIEKITFPAIYGSDNSIKDVKQLKYTRYLINSSTYEKIVLDSYDPSVTGSVFSANKKVVVNAPEDYVAAADEVVCATEILAANYTVYYEVKDAANTANSINFPLSVSTVAFIDNLAPAITFSTALPSSVKPGAVVNFALPTAEDKNASGTVIDARTKLETFYEVGTTAKTSADIASILGLSAPLVVVDEDDKSHYEINVALTETAGKKLFVYVVSTDDSGNQGLLVKTVNIVNIEDAVAPTFTSIDITNSSFEETKISQDDKVVLPTITFTDNVVTHTNIKAFVVHVSTGETFSVANQNVTRDFANNTITLTKGEFQATLFGEYSITFVATDAGNNITAKAYSLTVAKTISSSITLSSLPTAFIDQKMELGEKIEMPVPKVVSSNGVEVEEPIYTVTKIAGGNAELDQEKFIPSDTGTYKIAYNVSEDIEGAIVQTFTQTYTIVVTDTKAPTITVNGSFPDVLEKGASYEIPKFSASDSFSAPTVSDPNWVAYGVGIDESSLKIEILRTSILDGEVIYYNDEDSKFNRVFAQNGVYTIRYSAKDILGHETTKEYTIKVGDTINPVLEIENEDVNLPTTVKLGSKFRVDLTNISMDDDKDNDLKNAPVIEYLKVTVTNLSTSKEIVNNLKDGEGNITGFEYNIETVGNYRVQYEIRDNAGNTATQYHSFTVNETENTGNIVGDDFWTPFLIVVSLLVLGGVITYFAVSKSKTKKSI
ncbi:MAG: hypothetical protein WCR30_03300 [Clostridia bacterium]